MCSSIVYFSIHAEGVDFTASYDSVVAIDGEATMYCVNIFTTDDSIVEGDESFEFTLNSTSEGELIEFIIRNTTIIINDNDGKHSKLLSLFQLTKTGPVTFLH